MIYLIPKNRVNINQLFGYRWYVGSLLGQIYNLVVPYPDKPNIDVTEEMIKQVRGDFMIKTQLATKRRFHSVELIVDE